MTTGPETEPENACPCCPHPLDSHDVIARRFCAATSTGHLERGCVCGGPAAPPKPKEATTATTAT
ncbi:RGCVC family protein [Amycolatopsis sp. PS_44_ISF1]|uniref:RGCVC family protein n=1 Tax=Amycolatopsis sp. PS_44_ISF1 TaxID=2974917 RepID=UPI0028DD5FCB|nr:RGCVC family protein [Amycolatopsis sp. PS_44_ISF1]MDT8910767.1 RGCVC family protein [Amycolatopsis sp. PS_44_ISF1]